MMTDDAFQFELFDHPTAPMSEQLEAVRTCHRERLRLQTCDPVVQAIGPLILSLARLAAQRDATSATGAEQ